MVEETTLKLDLYRRDFSINAMALALAPARFGQLIDFFGSQRDLKERKLRVLHSLSFVEDPSRVVRGVRFEQRYDFEFDRQTSALIHAAVSAGFFKNLPGRRLAHEFRQLFEEREPLKGLERLDELGVLAAIHPDLNLTAGLRERLTRVRETLTWFRLLFTGEDFSAWRIHILSLSDGLGPQRLVELAATLGLNDSEIAAVQESRSRCQAALAALMRATRPSEAVASLEKLSLDELLFGMARSSDERLRGQLSSFITTWRHYQPLASGQDLLALGFRPGRALGVVLRQIRDRGLNGEIRDRAAALELALAALKAAE
ncbi:MAG: Multifunctional CCA protein [Deltaproteobacteria bacterium ADurb.Bin510]|nr:MAG: Multifunctional CCA protein [Deltaproteobacteria bacterium ADurb.Bin510]